MLKIYGHFLSSPTNKVRLCVSYLELPHEYIHVDLQSGANVLPEYLEINPHGRVPSIDDDGFLLSQSDAINRYLCAVSGPSSFYPDDIKKQAIVNQWIDFASQHVLMDMARVFYNRIVVKFTKETPDENAIDFGIRRLERDMPYLDQQLAQTPYVGGDHLSLADISLIAALEPSEMVGFDLTRYPEVSRWREDIMKRGFYRQVHGHFGAEMQA